MATFGRQVEPSYFLCNVVSVITSALIAGLRLHCKTAREGVGMCSLSELIASDFADLRDALYGEKLRCL